MSAPVKAIDRFHFLDGLRGYAILLTIVTHSASANVVRYLAGVKLPLLGAIFIGFTSSGPALFFVLSGMVILRPYIRKQKTLKPMSYAKGRFRRLYPTYLGALAFGAFVVWFNTHYASWYNERGMRMQFSWMETFKEALVVNLDGQFYNLAWWSLGVEVAFYTLVPLFIALCPPPEKLHNRRVFSIVLGSVISIFVIEILLTSYAPTVYSLTYIVLTVGRFFDFAICFVMGMLLGAKDFSMKTAWGFVAVGFVLLVGSHIPLPMLNGNPYYPLHESGYALIYSGMIVMAFHVKAVAKFWSKPILIWFGERSYSLYLVHFSVFYLVDNIVSHFLDGRNWAYAVLTRGIGIPLAIVGSIILFQLVERKFVRGLMTEKAVWPWQLSRATIHETPAPAAPQPVKASTETVS